jgi:RHS repeat-associated protein
VTERAADSPTATLTYAVTYTYDVNDQVIQQSEWLSSSTTTATTRFANADGEVWADLTSGNALAMRYMRPDGINALGARLSSGGTAAWHLTDYQNSVMGMTDNSGVVQDKDTYDPFGLLTNETNATVGDRFHYGGEPTDITTKLQEHKERWYRTDTGTWTEQDPSGLTPDPDPYRYVRNGPTNGTDPTGRLLFASKLMAEDWVQWISGNGGDMETGASPVDGKKRTYRGFSVKSAKTHEIYTNVNLITADDGELQTAISEAKERGWNGDVRRFEAMRSTTDNMYIYWEGLKGAKDGPWRFGDTYYTIGTDSEDRATSARWMRHLLATITPEELHVIVDRLYPPTPGQLASMKSAPGFNSGNGGQGGSFQGFVPSSAQPSFAPSNNGMYGSANLGPSVPPSRQLLEQEEQQKREKRYLAFYNKTETRYRQLATEFAKELESKAKEGTSEADQQALYDSFLKKVQALGKPPDEGYILWRLQYKRQQEAKRLESQPSVRAMTPQEVARSNQLAKFQQAYKDAEAFGVRSADATGGSPFVYQTAMAAAMIQDPVSAGGIVQTYVGAGMIVLGIMAGPGGVYLIVPGAETLQAGVRQAYTGQPTDTLLKSGYKFLYVKLNGGNEELADFQATGMELFTYLIVDYAATGKEPPLAPRTGPGVFRAEADLLNARLGAAQLSHPEEYASIIRQLEAAGVQIERRAGTLAYSPQTGGPGRIILDPDASIGALRHEFQHFLDNQAANFPGLGAYYRDLPEFARVEVRGYMQEVLTARQTGNADLVPQIVEQMRARVREVLGR